jgi:hypothetical protein
MSDGGILQALAQALISAGGQRPEYQPQFPNDAEGKFKALAILMANKDKNFVQRALYPDQSPSYDDGQGFHGSHYMGWTTVEDGPLAGKHIVYPNIVQRTPNRGLEMLKGADAVRYALKSGEYIPFDDPKEADWFSEFYKSIWKK